MEYRTVTTLTTKREQIEATIDMYEQKLSQARADLKHVIATIAIFEATGEARDFTRYIDMRRLFKRGEMTAMCKAFLRDEGPLTTRELAERVMVTRGFDPRDTVIQKAMGMRVIQAMYGHALDGRIVRLAKRKGHCVWGLPPVTAERLGGT